MSSLDDYVVDHLILLVGTNPLPNYVAARLLAKPQSRIVLVYSKGTLRYCKALEQVLRQDYEHFTTVEVEEANAKNINYSIQSALEHATGSIGLHYTGGTKAMAVHAYRAVEQLQRPNVYFSYLDAQRLELWIGGTGLTGQQRLDVALKVELTIKDLLRLHDLSDLAQSLRQESIWPNVTRALAQIHSDKKKAGEWRTWCKEKLRISKPDNSSSFRREQELKQLRTDDLPFQVLREALEKDLEGCSFPATFEELIAAARFKRNEHRPFYKADDKMAKWFDGAWLEDYVFTQLQAIADDCQIRDYAMNISPKFNGNETFEFDVAAMRGYQLFALSCTTSDKQGKCKLKLLEAAIRAEQMGGAEARVGLVCCSDDPESLQKQLNGLVREGQVRVFGRKHLFTLKDELTAWLKGLC